jgi:hypothetical protein
MLMSQQQHQRASNCWVLQGFVVDKDDSSLTRSNAYMLELFEKAGMEVSWIMHWALGWGVCQVRVTSSLTVGAR